MLKNIFNTFFTKSLTAAMNLLGVILLSRLLGADGKGVSSIIITTVSFLLVFSNLFAGTTIVYFVPRISNPALIWLGYLWTAVTCITGYIVLKITALVPDQYSIHITLIAGIQSLLVIHSKWLLGKEEVVKSNILTIIQSALMLVGLIFLFFGVSKHINSYLFALYLSFGATYLVSVWNTKKYWGPSDFGQLLGRFKEVFMYGMYNQAENFLYLLTLRVNFYVLEYFEGNASVGIYSNGVALAEAIWLITYSVSLVLYSRLSNSNDVRYAQDISWRLAKMTFYFSLLGIVAMALIPASFYSFIFGPEFNDVPLILWIFSPGVSIFSCALVILHYYSGVGRVKWNLVFSLFGFSFVIILSYLLIPRFGYLGAAYSASLSYGLTGLVILVVFMKEAKRSPSEILLNWDEWKFLKEYVSRNQ